MINELDFSEEEVEQLYKITELYQKVKELILFSEEFDPERRVFIQPINELRNAMDHLMRVFAYKFGIKSSDMPDYAMKNIDKTLGHVYRAGYDVLDWLSINIRDQITEELDGISHEAICKIFPEYYREIKPYIVGLSEEISKLRSEKDIAGKEVCLNSFNNFEQYVEHIKKLKGNYDRILKIKPSLIEYDEKRKRSQMTDYGIKVGIAIASLIAGFLARAYLT